MFETLKNLSELVLELLPESIILLPCLTTMHSLLEGACGTGSSPGEGKLCLPY
jgi:hypothetical protein